MTYRLAFPVFALLILLIGTVTPVPAQSQHAVSAVDDAQEAAARVRTLYFQQDFSRGHRLGQQFRRAYPNAPRLAGWTIMLRGLDTDGLLDAEETVVENAIAAADSMRDAAPSSPWSWFALAGTTRLHDERENSALAHSKTALRHAPNTPDLIWLRAKVLLNLDKQEKALSFIEEHRSEVANPAPLLTVKGRALSTDTTMEQAFAAYEQARAVDSTHVRAYYYPGSRLLRQNQPTKAHSLLKEAARLAPTSVAVHETYWRSMIGLPNRPDSAKLAGIERDVQNLLDRREDDIPALYAASQVYEELGADEKKETTRERILTEAPNSVQAEWVRVWQYREFEKRHRDSLRSDSTLRAQYRSMLTDFLERDPHHNMELVGGAYRDLFQLAKADSTVSDERLLELVNGMAKYETANPHIVYGEAPITLANRTSYYERATELAREGLETLPANVRKDSVYMDNEQEYQRRLDWASRTAHDALGWVHFKAGRTAKAKKHLQKAHALDSKHEQRFDVQNLYHLGQLYEAQGKLKKAESFYVKGKGQDTMQDNPNGAALKALYKKRHGSLDGYETYVSKIEDRLRTKRKKEVLAQRIKNPDPLSAFTLETLQGDTLSADQLDGTVAVINVWGTWCAPCVKEMPAIQKLYEKYQSTDSVRVLTINNDDNPNKVRQWMEKHDYTFPVLLDNGYLSENDVHAFPTTWFTTEAGRRVAFEKEGYTENLVEAFSWRVEALRDEDGGTE